MNKEDALKQLHRFCVYQDRCHSEVRTKLIKLKIYGQLLEEVMAELISDDFLNEERFAISYASGKFKINQWGKQKIKQGLMAKRVSSYCINKALSSLDEEEYYTGLEAILLKKKETIKSTNSFDLKKKIINYGLGKGYDYGLISEIINGWKA